MGLPRPARRRRKGVLSTVENTPFGTPRERKGQKPLDPRTADVSFQQPYVGVYLLNDLVRFSFRSAAAAVLVRAAVENFSRNPAAVAAKRT